MKHKFLKVALAGLPNAGKSTLMNYLIGEKISIMSPKAQTTRDVIRGIFIENDTQIIFIDTPGIFIPKRALTLERKIVKAAWSGVEDGNVIILLIDSNNGFTPAVKNLLDDLNKKGSKIILALNKVDEAPKQTILETTKEISEYYKDFAEIFMISAKTGHGVEDLKNYLISIAPYGEWMYPEDEITDAPMKFMAAEITREQLFLNLDKELPYSINVETDSWEEFKNGDIKINQTIQVFKDSQKAIILGKRGSFLKQIGILARQEMEAVFERKVHLFLFVKKEENWVDKKFN